MMNKSAGVRAIALIGIAVLGVLLLHSAASAWRNDNVTNNTTTSDDQGWRVAVDSSGNVVVGGYSENASGDNAVVTKLQGTNGTELWNPRCTLPSGTAARRQLLRGSDSEAEWTTARTNSPEVNSSVWRWPAPLS